MIKVNSQLRVNPSVQTGPAADLQQVLFGSDHQLQPDPKWENREDRRLPMRGRVSLFITHLFKVGCVWAGECICSGDLL